MNTILLRSVLFNFTYIYMLFCINSIAASQTEQVNQTQERSPFGHELFATEGEVVNKLSIGNLFFPDRYYLGPGEWFRGITSLGM